MVRRWLLMFLGVACLMSTQGVRAQTGSSVPSVPREFRGVWIASVSNIDWPSRKGMTVQEQQADLRSLLDMVKQMRANAVILQMRPAGDALYPSAVAPWSEYLTGTPGKAPSPAWDPLAFAVKEAHERGIEIHAWMNPFRGAAHTDRSRLAPGHIGARNPQILHTYGKSLWLEPSSPIVQKHVLDQVVEIVTKYDIDGIHFDDYFYPYPETGKPFPDDTAYQAYKAGGGTLGRDDWRRDLVNTFIRNVASTIKRHNPRVKFGISPFGIWQPGHPPGIKGLNAYASLYADARLWTNEGIVDYIAPQLYWGIDDTDQSFPKLLAWWVGENKRGRHVWPGLAVYKIPKDYDANEIVREIDVTRAQPGASGHILFRAANIKGNVGGIKDALAKQSYTVPALVPPSPWLDNEAPAAPVISFDPATGLVSWRSNGQEPAFVWTIAAEVSPGKWWMDTLPAGQTSLKLKAGAKPAVIAVSAVDRLGNESQKAIIRP
ncbi:MAG: hypothetical protein PWP23_319 [Candidatus Sumerlaeota bacterium]|nr:hypothetical protein [Candidatus Sumerlaeota bacterium]